MLTKAIGGILVFWSWSFLSFADEQKFDVDYFTIGSVSIEKVEEDEFLPIDEAFPASEETTDDSHNNFTYKLSSSDIQSAIVVIEKIINVGKKVWEIVEKNKPVVDVSLDTAHALPDGILDWGKMEGWSEPTSTGYHVTYKNVLGIKVIDFKYRFIYSAGGSYEGKGKYISQVNVVIENLEVAWGYTFNAQAMIPSINNIGTAEDPVASMEAQLIWTIDTVLKHSESTVALAIRGDGEHRYLTEP